MSTGELERRRILHISIMLPSPMTCVQPARFAVDVKHSIHHITCIGLPLLPLILR